MISMSGVREGLLGVATTRHRRLLIAAALTLATSALLLGLIGGIRWRGRQAMRTDTGTVISQTSLQLVRSLQSRRGTLTFLRDTLNRQPALGTEPLAALGASAVQHTRDLLGIGLVRSAGGVTWWSKPDMLSKPELAELVRVMGQRTRLRGAWRVPSTFVAGTESGRPLLVMLEPLRRGALRESAVAGVFELKPLLADFFDANLSHPYPVQVLDGGKLLFQTGDWSAPGRGEHRIVAQDTVALDAARWLLKMQPGESDVAQTLSWLNALVIGLGLIAALGITALVWILAARTWILERAVNRRTAALRRASERLRQLAIRDELTGLYNRRFFLERLAWEFERAKRYDRPFACLMVDLNGFKQVNDRLGHQAGDLVLRKVAQELLTLLRHSDILARFGGDEFAVALPETTTAQAEAVAEKLRSVHIPADPSVEPVTLSVGMSRLEPERETPEQMLEAADRSLYAWKERLKASRHAASSPRSRL